MKILARAQAVLKRINYLTTVWVTTHWAFLGALDLGRQTLTELNKKSYKAKQPNTLGNWIMVCWKSYFLSIIEDAEVSQRAKEARKELEEIFGHEMETITSLECGGLAEVTNTAWVKMIT